MSARKHRNYKNAAATERVFLGPQIGEHITSEEDVTRAIAAQYARWQEKPLNTSEIARGQELVLEAFGEQPTLTPSADAAAQQTDPPFVILCRTLISRGRRGARIQNALQNDVWPLTVELGESTLFAEWDKAMAPVQHLANVASTTTATNNNSKGPHPAARQKLIHVLAAPAPSASIGQLVRSLEDLIGVSCLGALIVPTMRHLLAIFDYHETMRFAVCVLFTLHDDRLFAEYGDERASVLPSGGNGATEGRDFFTLAPTYFHDAASDAYAAQKQQEQPKLMRWVNTPAVYVTYLYFDRIEKPYAALIQYI